MAAGSTRSVFHLSFARDSNIADVTAKGEEVGVFGPRRKSTVPEGGPTTPQLSKHPDPVV